LLSTLLISLPSTDSTSLTFAQKHFGLIVHKNEENQIFTREGFQKFWALAQTYFQVVGKYSLIWQQTEISNCP